MNSVHPITMWPIVVLVLIAAIIDLRSDRIPNWLVLPFLAGGLVVSVIWHGWSGLGQSLLGILTAAAVMGVFCYLGGLGMGDLKLCAAVGAWVGPWQMFVALVLTSMVGGVMALGWALYHGLLLETFTRTGDLLLRFRKRGVGAPEPMTLDSPSARAMPYAPAIAIGTICSFLGKS